MSVKRILISINVRWWNAEAAYALNLARGLVAEGCWVRMIVNPGSPVHSKAEAIGIPVITDIQLDSVSPLVHLKNLRRLLQEIDREKIQLINSFKSNGSFLFSLARRFRPALSHIKTRGEARAPRRNALNRLLYSGCDGIIAVGSPVLGWLQDLGLTGQRMKVIHYGDTGMENAVPEEKEAVRKQLHIPPGAIVLTLLGRTQAVKGHQLLLEALKRLKRKTCHLLFLVKDLDEFPEELRRLEAFIDAHDLRESVTITGFQEELGRVLSITDLGVIPSLASEVNCRVAVEFFSMGIPVLSFPTGTLPDIIRHEGNGFLTREKSASDLVEGVKWILSDPDRMRLCGEEAKKDFCEHYTIEKMTGDTLAFYQSCTRS